MKTIPLTQAIALLNQAVDVVVEGQTTTNLFQIGEEGEPFLTLETEEDFSEFRHTFEDAHNQEVEVDGDYMTLVASPDHPDNPEPTPVRMRLLASINLEPPGIPPRILKALMHVRSRVPEVDRVTYWADGRWQYSSDDHGTPGFLGAGIDVGILEDAIHDLPGDAWPLSFQLSEEQLQEDLTAYRSE